jgi:predicted TIM-barrel fold metal-dependent hydrolase
LGSDFAAYIYSKCFMSIRLTRRHFLASAVAATWLVRHAAAAPAAEPSEAKPILDIHIHLIGAGDNRSGCLLSAEIQEKPLFKLLVDNLELRRRAPTIDEGYVLALAEQLQQSGVAKAVVLAQDAVYDDRGRLDQKRTHFYVPNDYLFQVTGRYPKLMIPCVSINPNRADATEELDRCLNKGARILKIHPPIQGVDIGQAKHKRFFRRCAEKNVLVMVHTGHEHSGPVIDIDFANPTKLRLALDEGCTVVACHCGTGRSDDQPDMLPAFLKMLREYEKQGNLWGDTAVLGGFGRSRDFTRLLADDYAKTRLLHGSDFPFPAVPLEFAEKIGRLDAVLLQLDPNLIRQDFALKEALGIGRSSAERAYRLLCNGESRS